MLQEFYTILNFNFNMIYNIHKISVLLKSYLNYPKNSICKLFLRSVIDSYFFEKLINFFHNIKWWKVQGLKKMKIGSNIIKSVKKKKKIRLK